MILDQVAATAKRNSDRSGNVYPIMLTPTQWAIRIGVNPALVSTVGDGIVPTIKGLTVWRFLSASGRAGWEKTVTDRLYGAGRQDGMKGALWREIYHKKTGLFGSGTYGDVDPIQAYRHPWCLRHGEFISAMQAVDLELPPSSVPDDRMRLTSMVSKGALVAGVGATGAATLGITLAPGIGQILAIIRVAGAAGAAIEWEQDRLESSRFSAQLAALKPSTRGRRATVYLKPVERRYSSQRFQRLFGFGGVIAFGSLLGHSFDPVRWWGLTGALGALVFCGGAAIVGLPPLTRTFQAAVGVILLLLSLIYLVA